MVLQNSTPITKVIQEWKNNQLVNQREIICNKDSQKKDFDFKKQKDDKIINVTFKNEYYGRLEEKFNVLSNNKNETEKIKWKSLAINALEQTR